MTRDNIALSKKYTNELVVSNIWAMAPFLTEEQKDNKKKKEVKRKMSGRSEDELRIFSFLGVFQVKPAPVNDGTPVKRNAG